MESGADTGVLLESLTGGFGREPAIRDLDLCVEAGELFGLLGPNGAGKTTTISILATLLRPTSGDARVFGQSVLRTPARVRALVGLVHSSWPSIRTSPPTPTCGSSGSCTA